MRGLTPRVVRGVWSVCFSPDGRRLATWASNQGCRLWVVGTWREERRFDDAYIAFSPDSRLLALSDRFGVIRLVEVDTGREVVRLTGPEPMWYRPACFSPDGTRLIATGSDQKALYVWDLRLIREGLKALDLDWDAPPYSLAPDPATRKPLRLTVVTEEPG